MCGCSANIKSAKQGAIDLSYQKILNRDFASILVWAWCINPDKVKSEIKSKTGLDISESDLQNIIKIHQNGNDVKQFKVDFKDMLTKNGLFTIEELNNSSCNYNLNLPTA